MKGSLRTVTEVCEITKLTKKLLFDYEDVVPPTERYGHNSKGKGYKLYDDKAVLKLYQIAIFRELGIPRKEIRKQMKSPDYDSNEVLRKQIRMLQKQQKKVENQIAAAQEMLFIGINDIICESIKKVSILQIGAIIERLKSNSILEKLKDFTDKRIRLAPNQYRRFETLLGKYLTIGDDQLGDEETETILDQLIDSGIQALHAFAVLEFTSIGLGIQGEGEFSESLSRIYTAKFSAAHGRKLLSYLETKVGEMIDSAMDEILTKLEKYVDLYFSASPFDLESQEAETMASDIKAVLKKYFGMEEYCEYEIVFRLIQEGIKQDKDEFDELFADLSDDPELIDCLTWIYRVLKYYTKDQEQENITERRNISEE